MLTRFSLHHFRFHLEPKAPLRMPAHNKGNVIRGGFGSTFRRIVCHVHCPEPETCELKQVCPYTAVFHPFVPEDSEKISKNRDIPRPFVIKPPLETKLTYLSGERLSFDFIVVGKVKEYLPYFIVTFKELSRAGLGRDRAACELTAVEALSPSGEQTSVYSSADNRVFAPTGEIRWESLCKEYHREGNANREPMIVRLKFLTPTTLRADGRIVRTPNFEHLLKRLRDRINALSYFYCGAALDIDFRAFGNEAERVRTLQSSIQWLDSSRYSKRRETRHDLSGFVGEITFEGKLAPFLPYLRLGEYLHVGKNAVFGNGWYRIEEITGEVPHERSRATPGSPTE